jgi:hypothetical protein
MALVHNARKLKFGAEKRGKRKKAFLNNRGAQQQTSERAAPPVSVEEKGKATGAKRKILLFLLMSIQY